MPLGYDKPLYLLPFDHRSTFVKTLLGIEGVPTPEEKETLRAYKRIIYEAFLRALLLGVPRDGAAILLDEEYGEKILKEAVREGLVVCLAAEKSGQTEFQFEYGEDFGRHIKNINPTFVKALVRYNPRGDREKNRRDREKLRILSDFCHTEGYKFLLEPIVPPTPQDLIKSGGETARYDQEIRPEITPLMMREFQEAGIEPDIWKIEGMRSAADYKKVTAVARNSGARRNVGVIILGRGADRERVIAWLVAGRGVEGIIGFAVGRTVFLEPLKLFKEGHMNETETISRIARSYKDFYDIFTKKISF